MPTGMGHRNVQCCGALRDKISKGSLLHEAFDGVLCDGAFDKFVFAWFKGLLYR